MQIWSHFLSIQGWSVHWYKIVFSISFKKPELFYWKKTSLNFTGYLQMWKYLTNNFSQRRKHVLKCWEVVELCNNCILLLSVLLGKKCFDLIWIFYCPSAPTTIPLSFWVTDIHSCSCCIIAFHTWISNQQSILCWLG